MFDRVKLVVRKTVSWFEEEKSDSNGEGRTKNVPKVLSKSN